VILVLVALSAIPNPPSWVSSVLNSTPFQIQFLAIIGGTLGLGLIVLIAAARRTPDIIFRRHLMLLGLFFALGTASVLNDFTISFAPLDALLALSNVYVWYRATMTLTIVSRVEE